MHFVAVLELSNLSNTLTTRHTFQPHSQEDFFIFAIEIYSLLWSLQTAPYKGGLGIFFKQTLGKIWQKCYVKIGVIQMAKRAKRPTNGASEATTQGLMLLHKLIVFT